ncbi:MAG: transporter substrate-binding domain-containing protein [Holophaga sp.]|nr:transporter substrate-binding domain-containing protein [Holophaga sp.]
MVAAACLAPSLGAKVVFRIAYWPYPPNLIVDRLGATASAPKGAIVEVWENYIAPKADLEIRWIGPVPFSRALTMVENGEADAVQHLSRTPEREKTFLFSRHPIMWGRQGVVVLAKDPLERIKDLDDVKGKKIGMIRDGYLAPFFQENRRSLRLEEVFGQEAAPQNVRKLLASRLWGIYFTFPDVLLYYVALEHRTREVKVIPFPGSDKDEVTFAAMSRKLDPKLVERINKAIDATYQTYNYTQMANTVSEQAAAGSGPR